MRQRVPGPPASAVRGTIVEFIDGNPLRVGAALSFHTLLSPVPLLIVVGLSCGDEAALSHIRTPAEKN